MTKPIKRYRQKSWDAFRSSISPFLQKDWTSKRRYLFRGQPNVGWGLRPSLDRLQEFEGKDERDALLTELVNEFRREVGGKAPFPIPESDLETWEMLGRHHGLPTRLLDWTSSPYIAAFYAFDQWHSLSEHSRSESVSVWLLDRDSFRSLDVLDVEIVDANWPTNPRAQVQRGSFTRLLSTGRDVERVIPSAVSVFEIPATQASHALSDLDEMNITPTSLQLDLDGAARTVTRRLLDHRPKGPE